MRYRLKKDFPTFPNITYAWIAVAAVWIFLLARLYTLQVENRKFYAVKSEENRIVRMTLLSARGEILDRAGNLLSASRFVTDLVAPNRRMKLKDLNALAERLSPILGVRPDHLRDAYVQKRRKTYSYQTIPIVENLTPRQTIQIGENLWRLPEVQLEKRLTRWYPAGPVLSHALGYVNEVSKEDMDRDPAGGGAAGAARTWGLGEPDPGYRMGSVIGRSGVEEILEPYLRGRDGWYWAEIDAHGRIRNELKHLQAGKPIPGASVQLTLDLKMSMAFEEAFGDSNGFGILMDARTGAVRAMFSRPAFDPNRMVTTDIAYIRDLQADPGHPFFNRAVQSAFPPGSTFKIVNFVAGVEEGLASKETRFYCSGKYRLGRRIAECWKEKGHGWISLQPALTHSCNVFFYNLGLKLGVDRMAAYGRRFQLGQKTGFILSRETPGILPDAEWKFEKTGEVWTNGDDLNMSVGQGFLLVTPLQQVSLMASLFNGGRLLKPYLVDEVRRLNGDTLPVGGMRVRSDIQISDTTLSLLREALKEVVVRGTGYRAGHDHRYKAYPVDVYGKTGTVQRASREAVEKTGEDPEDHGWFLCCFELNGEMLVGVVMKESAGHGGTVAAPVIGRFIERMIGWRT